MPKPIIEIENISKCYRIGAHKEPYLSLRDEIAKLASRLRPRTKDQGQSETDFWALKDVSFSVNEGEAVGIIGRNGAGKSTLLKILSQITPPTKGKITMRGRVASLLEVGTGFHPELTGRENIFLNGTILGMSRAEVARKFDEIVAFAEIEKFLDTPVKRYSSGMYVRLAFAVAAHLEPEILIVDEVLAVGDSQFQKKCLGKMGEVAKSGRTVLFVSHNMGAISALCNACVLIKNGFMDFQGATDITIQKYLNVLSETANIPVSERKDRQGSGVLRFTDVWVENNNGERVTCLCSGDSASIVATYESELPRNHENIRIAIALRGTMNELITDLCNEFAGQAFQSIPPRGKIICRLPKLPLNAGRYGFNIFLSVNGIIADYIIDVGEIHVEAGDFYGSGKLPGRRAGENGWSKLCVDAPASR